MSEKKKESILYNIVNALYQIYQGHPPVVWYVFMKNIIEAVFDAFCGVYFIKYIYECIENHVDFHKLFVLVSVFCIFHIVVHLISAYGRYLEDIARMKIYRHIFQKMIHRAKKIKLSQYENPKFYDSFSSALDPRAEYELNKNIMNKVGDATVIFISHRLSTTRDADCIYMFEHGEIIEQGTHQELMALGGQYADMFRCQAKYYQENVEVFDTRY